MQLSKTLSQLTAVLKQENRVLSLSFPNSDVPCAFNMVVNHIDAQEKFNQDFEFKLEIISDLPDLPLDDAIGKMASVACKRHDGSLRYFNGFIFSFRLIRNDGSFSTYEMILKPWLAFLKYKENCKIFQNINMKDRTQEILSELFYKPTNWMIRGEDPEETFSVQYNESDYNYLHRMLERRGWIYWYEHTEVDHTLCIADQSLDTQPIFSPGQALIWRGQNPHNNLVGILGYQQASKIGFTKFASASFDFKSPIAIQTDVKAKNTPEQKVDLERFNYAGTYGFKDEDIGRNQLDQKRLAQESAADYNKMICNNAYAEVGKWFKLTEFEANNSGEQEFLIVGMHHKAGNNYLQNKNRMASYEAELLSIMRETPWKPELYLNSLDTRIYGMQTALVVGPPDEEIYTDKYGRIKVQFHWDRYGKQDDLSSAWVRVASAWAGSNFGMVSIPRIGQEVIVQFLEGNPDRPLVTGSVYNEDNLPPWDLPDNATQSGILSRSSKGATPDNANAIRFEDKKGEEEVWIHAEKDQRIEVENNESHSVGVDRSKTVGSNETVSIGVDRTETVGKNETINIGVDRTETVGNNEIINIGVNRTETVGNNETITIQQNRTKTVVANEKVTVQQNQVVSVGLNKMETVSIAKALNVGAGYAVTVGAGHALTVVGAMNTAVGLAQFEQVGLNKSIYVGKSFNIDVADSFEVRVGSSSFQMKSDGTIVLSGVKIRIEADSLVQIDGKDVEIN
ncbi:type VI secretion system Vgr family protein [Acinetobacter equi]|uniref:Type VI secretion protein VgrG n=1 Tax=Acinetobacter equi TaxID=1324350 RepID=A0A0N9V8K0_9GAMM|nr:type VI secretion system tip protein TssI/VgrG [Acinetobacter equi]ALH95479.1 type VI secretion protein VgrG [Acinetobacter equi]